MLTVIKDVSKLVADRFAVLFAAAGLPSNLLTPLHLSPTLTQRVASHPVVKFVSFTGSVQGGRGIERAAAASETIKGVALEVSNVVLSWLMLNKITR